MTEKEVLKELESQREWDEKCLSNIKDLEGKILRGEVKVDEEDPGIMDDQREQHVLNLGAVDEIESEMWKYDFSGLKNGENHTLADFFGCRKQDAVLEESDFGDGLDWEDSCVFIGNPFEEL